MRVKLCVLATLISLGLAGCNTFGKKPHGADTQARAVNQRRQPQPEREPPPPDPSAPPQGVNGILAGMILDYNNQRPPATYIQVVEAREAGAPGAPIDIAADSQGYFTVQGLQPGRHYQLIARARDGARPLVGSTWATPPDPKVFIRLTEDTTGQTIPIPPAGPSPVLPGQGTPTDPALPAPSWPQPPAPDNTPRAADLGPPVGAQQSPRMPSAAGPPPVTQPPVQNVITRPEMTVVIQPQAPKANSDPIVGIPAANSGAARVPSCDLTGKTLQNFALNDVNGQPWEFRKHPARLTLIDFWGTWCLHCLQAVPNLNVMQERYRSYGLQVVGIAYEEGSVEEQVKKVNRVRQRLAMNYQVLLGADRNKCPVKTQFRVQNFPTLFLVDSNGTIVWFSEGLDAKKLKELDVIIKQQLQIR